MQLFKMRKNQATLSAEALTIEKYLKQYPSFVTSYAKALGATANVDGVTSLTELSLLIDIARRTASPAVVGAVMFGAILDETDIDDALSELADTAVGLDVIQRESAFVGSLSLLALQGPKAKKVALKFAKALDVKPDFVEVPTATEWGLFEDFIGEARRTFSRGDLADAMVECGRSLGHWGVIDHYQAYRRGEITHGQLFARVSALHDQMLAETNEGESTIEADVPVPLTLDSAAGQLRAQLQQRFLLLEERIRYEQQTFAHEVDYIVHDAGNAFERGMLDRLATDDWRKTQVWESIARTQFAEEAAHRIDRALKQREEGLRLLHEELRLFRSEIGIAQRVVFDREHHARFEALMPPLQLTARMLHRLDELAKATLGTGGVAVAGAGTAAYYLGTLTVFTTIAPALPYMGGALLAAGLVKWLLPPNERRKYAEIRDKRKALERVVRDKLEEAQTVHAAELERIYVGFCEAAPALLAPVALEAEALRHLPGMRKKLVKGAAARSRATLKRLKSRLEEVET